ncbi:ras-related protein Rab-40C isoform X1 [Eumetopias jubatus]|uniref:ras-related protein Rab-40C isoform X1 n=1 Tax=Eumetopias jubatus TaxID=34886 RepID=UPI001015E4E9|nr:ras-related protein Rab-40C isoform X1 [Eumetopias jubatus]XP_027967514.1 ras-related protein Rab-40C isoform X1 [Eumetopias jubatus]XP_027967515.1 ras-related protein Rab-40C isoform X1 [Eumetopias jubatus]XP_027967516.1 ras-related protein Rab-40C isoform X1 [Eumetopias jubatus]
MGTQGSPVKSYDYLLKFLLVGDSDVGKGEILESLQDGAAESPYAYSNGIDYKTTTILLDGRRVKLELWDTSGQGRFCTIFRSYSRGAQGILLVYDITNRWSFDGIDRWIKEIDEHAPGVPRILVGNRLHLAFKRQVPTEQARAYAEKNGMTFFEVSPLCNFNVIESFTELSRIVLMRHGMEKIWRPNRGKGLPRAVGKKTETDWGSGSPLRGRRPRLQGRPALLHCFPDPLAADLAKLALCGVLVFQEGTVQDILSAPRCWEAVLWTLPQSGKGAASKPALLELTHKGPGCMLPCPSA